MSARLFLTGNTPELWEVNPATRETRTAMRSPRRELLAKIQAELFLAENKKGMLEKDLANLVSERAPQLSTEYLIKVSST